MSRPWKIKEKHLRIQKCKGETPQCLKKFIKSRPGQKMCLKCWKELDIKSLESTYPGIVSSTPSVSVRREGSFQGEHHFINALVGEDSIKANGR